MRRNPPGRGGTYPGRDLGRRLRSRVQRTQDSEPRLRLWGTPDGGEHCETNVSAESPPTRTETRVSIPYEDAGGSGSDQTSTCQRARSFGAVYTEQMSEERGSATLPRSVRIRSSRDFRRIGRRGTRFASKNFVLLECERVPNGSGAGRIGITASRRVGNAVVRNRLKRRIREWFRRRRGRGDADWVIIVRRGAARFSAREMATELDAVADSAEDNALYRRLSNG